MNSRRTALNTAFLAAMDAEDYTEANRLADEMLALDGYVAPTAAETAAEDARMFRAEVR